MLLLINDFQFQLIEISWNIFAKISKCSLVVCPSIYYSFPEHWPGLTGRQVLQTPWLPIHLSSLFLPHSFLLPLRSISLVWPLLPYSYLPPLPLPSRLAFFLSFFPLSPFIQYPILFPLFSPSLPSLCHNVPSIQAWKGSHQGLPVVNFLLIKDLLLVLWSLAIIIKESNSTWHKRGTQWH